MNEKDLELRLRILEMAVNLRRGISDHVFTSTAILALAEDFYNYVTQDEKAKDIKMKKAV